MLDIFTSDAFGVVGLTESMNILPFKPGRIGELGYFRQKGVTTLTVTIERKSGRLSLIPAAARGSMPTYQPGKRRNLRAFVLPHLPHNDAVMADEVQGVRAFGTEDETETVTDKVNEKLQDLRTDHEVTHEYQRIGAMQGRVIDADGTSVLYDLFEEFDITQTEVQIDWANDDMKAKSQEIIRLMEGLLGGTTFNGIRCFMGDQAWDEFISNENVKGAFELYQDNQFARTQQNRGGFDAFGIIWENYRGKIGDVDFIPADEGRFVPQGLTNLFTHYSGPANFIETVNTVGKVVYAKQEVMRFDIGIELHTQSNPLFMCNRPEILIKGTPNLTSSSSA